MWPIRLATRRCFLAACCWWCWQLFSMRSRTANCLAVRLESARRDWCFRLPADCLWVFSTALWPLPCTRISHGRKPGNSGGLGTHLTGVLGGIIWGVGMSFNIIASGRAGFAISYGLGQGATMVAAFWGVFIWREFRTAPSGTSKLIAAMFACFLVGLALIIMARTS